MSLKVSELFSLLHATISSKRGLDRPSPVLEEPALPFSSSHGGNFHGLPLHAFPKALKIPPYVG